MDIVKKQRGGKREGAGRKPVGISTHAMALKLDNDLYKALGLASLNKNRYINDADGGKSYVGYTIDEQVRRAQFQNLKYKYGGAKINAARE